MLTGRYGCKDVQTWGVVRIEDLGEKRPGVRKLSEWAEQAFKEPYDPIPVQMRHTYDVIFRRTQEEVQKSGFLMHRTSDAYRVIVTKMNGEPVMRGYFALFAYRREELSEMLFAAFGFVDSPERRILPKVMYS